MGSMKTLIPAISSQIPANGANGGGGYGGGDGGGGDEDGRDGGGEAGGEQNIILVLSHTGPNCSHKRISSSFRI